MLQLKKILLLQEEARIFIFTFCVALLIALFLHGILKRIFSIEKKLKRLAASLIVLRQKNSAIPGDKFEILLVQRSRTMKFATSTWVFPGGVYDKADGDGVEDGLSFAENVDVLRRS